MMKDRWTDSGLVYVFFGLVCVLFTTATLFNWPSLDVYHSVVVATPFWSKAIGFLCIALFWFLFLRMAIDNSKTSIGGIILCLLALAAAISFETGFYGSYR